MAPKKGSSRASTPAAANTPQPAHSSSSNLKSSSASFKNTNDPSQIAQQFWSNYVDRTPQRVKLLDAFLAFLIAVGALQFVYCVIGGNYVSGHILFPGIPL